MFMFIENAIMHALHEKLENSTYLSLGMDQAHLKSLSLSLGESPKDPVYWNHFKKSSLGLLKIPSMSPQIKKGLVIHYSTFYLLTYKKWFTLHREIPKNIYILHIYVFYHAMKPKCISLLTY